MGAWGKLRQYLGLALVPALCVVVSIWFISKAVSGPTGYIAGKQYKAEHAELAVKVEEARQVKAALSRQVALLDPRGVDKDLADELVRRNLNMVAPDEVIVPLPPENEIGR